MRNCIKCCRKVQEDEDADMAGVGGDEQIICDFDEGGFCAMVDSEAGLKGFVELMVGHVLVELCGNCSFHDFAEERKVGDRTVIIEVIRVQSWFFEYRSD